MADECSGNIPIDREDDLILIRKTVRDQATAIGFGLTDTTRVVTAASELARNVYHYAGRGVMHWKLILADGRRGLELVFEDRGPGIPDINQAMQEGYTSSKGLGMGLPGTRRLMDEMVVHSELGKGTVVTIKKWVK